MLGGAVEQRHLQAHRRGGGPTRGELTYLLPLRRGQAEQGDGELAAYLRHLAARIDVIVIDGSAPAVRDCHRRAFGPSVVLRPPKPSDRCANGKAWGVISGLRWVRTRTVVLADDDVRWDLAGLEHAQTVMADADVLIPQNYFTPMIWHAAWDTGRTLLNRAVGHDWPGTLLLRAAALPGSPGYDGNVLFENCELVRTVEAHGGRVLVADDLFVARRPPTAAHFLAQRPRQAYDDLAQPVRMLCMLSVVPFLASAGKRRVAAVAVASVAAAEVGRRRHGGARQFPWYASLFAPLWLCERGILSWWAAWRWSTRRGVTYAGARVLTAANSPSRLRRAAGIDRRGHATEYFARRRGWAARAGDTRRIEEQHDG